MRAQADRLRYDAKAGAVMTRSIQEILQVNRNSAQYERVLAVARQLELKL